MTNLTQTVRYAIEHDTEVLRIAQAAQELVHSHLCADARMCYLYELLRRLGRATRYRP